MSDDEAPRFTVRATSTFEIRAPENAPPEVSRRGVRFTLTLSELSLHEVHAIKRALEDRKRSLEWTSDKLYEEFLLALEAGGVESWSG